MQFVPFNGGIVTVDALQSEKVNENAECIQRAPNEWRKKKPMEKSSEKQLG